MTMVPILTYHSMKIHGNGYADNDLAALASDLETIHALGLRIVALPELVAGWLRSTSLGEGVVALTCDDGGDFDFHDLPHPTAGPQRSVLNILRDFAERHPEARAHITSFVIASPEARTELDKTCMVGRGWWSDAWWSAAAASGLMAIANHSWDHNHDALPPHLARGGERGHFRSIVTRELADAQVRAAQEYLVRKAPNPGNALFAYPYGDVNGYLAGEYLPGAGRAMGLDAAFTTEARCFERNADRWAIPRFVFGRDWASPGQLEALLDSARR
jgi:peptidoglycan/xylan/chitin deacetylase (PgdA/CDA1 family)